jgi:GNAT superfamily N-acetyltransferase
VDAGTVPGLIGYENGVPVAWLSLGPREDYAKLHWSPVMKPVDDQPVDNQPVWSIVCFFVDREASGRGLSERMLQAAVDYARSCGARSPNARGASATSLKVPAGLPPAAGSRATRRWALMGQADAQQVGEQLW